MVGRTGILRRDVKTVAGLPRIGAGRARGAAVIITTKAVTGGATRTRRTGAIIRIASAPSTTRTIIGAGTEKVGGIPPGTGHSKGQQHLRRRRALDNRTEEGKTAKGLGTGGLMTTTIHRLISLIMRGKIERGPGCPLETLPSPPGHPTQNLTLLTTTSTTSSNTISVQCHHRAAAPQRLLLQTRQPNGRISSRPAEGAVGAAAAAAKDPLVWTECRRGKGHHQTGGLHRSSPPSRIERTRTRKGWSGT